MEVGQPAAATSFTGVLSPSPTSPAFNTNNPIQPAIATIPITWADLNLSGRLVYCSVSANGGNSSLMIKMLDLATGEIRPIFIAPESSWVFYLAASPDARQLMISYLPPAQGGSDASTSVYSLPLDGPAVPQVLFQPPSSDERYLQVEWSPDGKSLYFVYYNHRTQPANQPCPDFQISRMAYPDGQPERIVEHAL